MLDYISRFRGQLQTENTARCSFSFGRFTDSLTLIQSVSALALGIIASLVNFVTFGSYKSWKMAKEELLARAWTGVVYRRPVIPHRATASATESDENQRTYDIPLHESFKGDEAENVNLKTTISLSDRASSYLANRIGGSEGNKPLIMAKAPKGEIEEALYYEMVFLQNPGMLISLSQNYPDFPVTFSMLNGDPLTVDYKNSKTIEGIPGFRALRLSFVSNNEEREIEHWIIDKFFDYGQHGLLLAKMFSDMYKESGYAIPAIVDCGTEMKKAAVLIMWMQLFERINKGMLSFHNCTSDFLRAEARKIDRQFTTQCSGLDTCENFLTLYPTVKAIDGIKD